MNMEWTRACGAPHAEMIPYESILPLYVLDPSTAWVFASIIAYCAGKILEDSSLERRGRMHGESDVSPIRSKNLHIVNWVDSIIEPSIEA